MVIPNDQKTSVTEQISLRRNNSVPNGLRLLAAMNATEHPIAAEQTAEQEAAETYLRKVKSDTDLQKMASQLSDDTDIENRFTTFQKKLASQRKQEIAQANEQGF